MLQTILDPIEPQWHLVEVKSREEEQGLTDIQREERIMIFCSGHFRPAACKDLRGNFIISFVYRYLESVRRFLAIRPRFSVTLTGTEEHYPRAFDLTTNDNLKGRDA